MDFGDILDSWESSTAKPYGKKQMAKDVLNEKTEVQSKKNNESVNEQRAHPMDVALRRYGIQDKDAVLDSIEAQENPGLRRRRLLQARVDATIDLHGLTRDEAWLRLEAFFKDSVNKGFVKVLIVHGKGVHSESDPVLKKMVRLFLEQNPYAGESGSGDKQDGGSGSTWVLLKTPH